MVALLLLLLCDASLVFDTAVVLPTERNGQTATSSLSYFIELDPYLRKENRGYAEENTLFFMQGPRGGPRFFYFDVTNVF